MFPPRSPQSLPLHLQQAYTTRHCVVCGVALTKQQAWQGHTCNQGVCQHHYYHIHRMRRKQRAVLPGRIPAVLPRCGICGWPLTPQEALQAAPDMLANRTASCADPICMQQVREKLEERHRQQVLSEQQRQAYRAQLRAHLFELRDALLPNPQEWTVVLLPGHTRQLVALSTEHRQAARAYLIDLIQQALAETAPTPLDAVQTTDSVINAACELCKGNCCITHDEHKNLDTQIVHRCRLDYPRATEDEILAALLACLPNTVYEQSCVYHGEQGCGLGRWRGQICRQYYCSSLKKLQKQQPTQAWGVSMTAGEPLWERLWPVEGDTILDYGILTNTTVL